MGLDQYAFSSHEPLREIDDGEGRAMLVPEVETKFVWRKHVAAQLHATTVLSVRLSQEVGTERPRRVQLQPDATRTDAVIGLEAAIKGNDLPKSLGGLFFGHEFKTRARPTIAARP